MAGDEAVRRWWRRLVQTSASPGAVRALRQMNSSTDARHTLPAIHVPTLVLQRIGDELNEIGESRYIAERIPGAELVELPGEDHAYFVDPEPVTREVEGFLRSIWDRGEWDTIESDRVLEIVHGTRAVSADTALRLARNFGTSERFWLNLQAQYDLDVEYDLIGDRIEKEITPRAV